MEPANWDQLSDQEKIEALHNAVENLRKRLDQVLGDQQISTSDYGG